MSEGTPVTEIQSRYAAAAGPRRLAFILFALILLLGTLAVVVLAYVAITYSQFSGRRYLVDETHFKYGSIGAELANGLPYKLFLALPTVFPEQFQPEKDYSHFGFIYQPDGAPDQNLPIGFAKGNRHGVEVAWFNCAVCHTGQVKLRSESKPRVIPGMPANTVNLEEFFLALFDMAVDKRFSWDNEAMKDALGASKMGPIERLLWEWVVMPNTRATLIKRRSELLPLLDPSLAPRLKQQETAETCPAEWQAADAKKRYCHGELNYKLYSHKPYWPDTTKPSDRWGPGRVDTFNPYKLISFDARPECLTKEERVGVADFPAIFMQAPRGERAMHLHWDGNNASLDERNVSAAIGAGVTEETANHSSIERIAHWLRDLKPDSPASTPGPGAENGKTIYMQACARCHGWQDKTGFVYEGAQLGQIDPIRSIGTDRGRLDSYTKQMEKYQKDRLFCEDSRHRFRFFKKTDGYANMPLDFLWLRAPYLHNGSVPTLKDLLKRPEERPKSFVRGLITLDPEAGGFEAPGCTPGIRPQQGFCFDTSAAGNGNGGHLYGTELSEAEKNDLLQYLLTF